MAGTRMGGDFFYDLFECFLCKYPEVVKFAAVINFKTEKDAYLVRVQSKIY